MSNRKITPPIDRIPIGLVTINGQSMEVRQHPEFVRFFFDLFARIGGVDAMSNIDLEAASQSILDASLQPASNPQAQEAMRAVDELRNEISSLRSDRDNLRRLLEEHEIELAGLRSVGDLRQRVEQLEDRFP